MGDPLVTDARPKYWGRKKRGVIAITPPSLALQRRCLDDKTFLFTRYGNYFFSLFEGHVLVLFFFLEVVE